MTHQDEILTSICQLRGITDVEAEKVWAAYFPRLLEVAHRRLAHLPKRLSDEEDVALSALDSFFRAQRAGKFQVSADFGDLWPLLVTIVSRKISAQQRRHKAQKRGAGAVRGESAFGQRPDDSSLREGLAQILDENRLPETSEEIARSCESLLLILPDEKHRKTALLRMEGYTHDEISEQLECSVARTKQRISRIKEIWGKLDDV